MLTAPTAFTFPYNFITKNYRLLHHEGLDQLLRYPELPAKTVNFDCYPVYKLRHGNQITLGGAATTVYQRYIDDAVVSETWPEDSGSMRAGFFYELMRFYNAALSSSQHLLWYPKDKTDLVFSIQPIDLVAGDSEQMEVNPIHGIGQNDYRWIRREVRFTFRIRKLYDAPNASITLEGL